MLLSRHLFACVIALAFAACSTPPTQDADAATDAVAPTDMTPVDVQPDVPPAPPVLTGPCMADTDCPSGGRCLLNTSGWPGGTCTQDCARDLDCVTDVPYIASVCRPIPGTTTRTCLRQCLNGFDCARPGYTCVKASQSATSGICVPSCTADSCGTGARCNEWTGQCQATSVMYPPAGNDDGMMCMHSGTTSECRSGQCIPQVNTAGTQSGWNGGYCLSDCALSPGWNSTSLYSSDTFPQSNCPAGSLCFPSSNDEAEQGPGQCLRGCMADTDCRAAEGYFCHRTFDLIRIRPDHTTYAVPHTFNNGICEPIDCLNDTTHTCPSGLMCSTRTDANGNMIGRCIPATAPTDAGTPTDSGTDAAD